jgi:hypothetical protein
MSDSKNGIDENVEKLSQQSVSAVEADLSNIVVDQNTRRMSDRLRAELTAALGVHSSPNSEGLLKAFDILQKELRKHQIKEQVDDVLRPKSKK